MKQFFLILTFAFFVISCEKKSNDKVTDKVTQIKVNEIIKLISPSSQNLKVNDEHLVNLLQYCDLVKELESVHEYA